jgi:hypothetical protein
MLIPGDANCGPGNKKTYPNSPPVAKMPYRAASVSVSSRTRPEDARANRGGRAAAGSTSPDEDTVLIASLSLVRTSYSTGAKIERLDSQPA